MKWEQLLELKHQRAEKLKEGANHLTNKDFEKHKALMVEVEKLNAEIDAAEKQLAEEGRFDDDDSRLKDLANKLQDQKDDEAKEKTLDELRGTNEYIKAFSAAISQQVSVKKGVGREEFNPLYKALTATGGTPAGSDGGFLVPVEFDNMIQTVIRDYVDLSKYFNVENVHTLSGWRAIETADLRTALPKIGEMGTIGKDAQPKFNQVKYQIEKYGDRLPVSSELLNDNTAGLLQYLADWFGPKYIMTKNGLLLGLLGDLTPSALTVGSEVKLLKQALTKGLRTAVSRSATLLTNQSGYAEMENWEDKNGRPYLVPNPTDPDVYRFKGRSVVYGDDDQVENVNATTAPLYLGNFKAYATLFMRKAIEIATTDVGGQAWETDSYELRAITRMDAQKVDASAAIARTITIPE